MKRKYLLGVNRELKKLSPIYGFKYKIIEQDKQTLLVACTQNLNGRFKQHEKEMVSAVYEKLTDLKFGNFTYTYVKVVNLSERVQDDKYTLIFKLVIDNKIPEGLFNYSKLIDKFYSTRQD